MAGNVSNNDILNMSQDWGKDASNGLPYSGRAIQKFIKEKLNTKAGVFYNDTSANRYLVFADEESRDKYLANPTQNDLVLGVFDAPFNYEASITLLSDNYVPIILGTKGNYVTFTFDIKNKSGVSVGESVNATWSFIRGNTKQTLKAKYRYGQTVTLNVDKYLAEGTNTILVSIVGETTLAATSVSVTYQVVNLQISSDYDISQSYNLQTSPSAVAAIPFTLSGYGTKTMEWYLDGTKLPTDAGIDEVTGATASRTKNLSLANLSQGSHSIQMRAYTVVDGEIFYSDTLYREVMVYTGVDRNPMIALSATLPPSAGILSGDLTLVGATQYIPYVIDFAVYNPIGAAVDVVIAVDGVKHSTITATSGTTNQFSYIATKNGSKTITFTAGETVRTLTLVVKASDNRLEEITEGLELDLQAMGKTNASTDRDQWVYKLFSTTFTGFKWNSQSGWVNGALLMGEGDSIDINATPLREDATETGKTLEFEFSTKGVSNDNALVCDLRDSSGTGILITASSVSLISSGGKVLTRPFKSEENIRVGFVINKDSGVTNKGLAFVYVNGINSGSVNFEATDNFMSSKAIRFAGTSEVSVSLRSLRFYNVALTDEQMLNNFTLYRPTVDEMMAVYDRNDIYDEGTEKFSMDKLANQLPVMIITGDIPSLEATTDKNKSIVVDVEYINYQNPEYSFTMKNAHMQPQGTSSMGYPKKNFRLYTQKRDDTHVYDANGIEIKSKLYAFKEGAAPVNCWCMKADYAESSSTHNTSIARLWNGILKNMKVGDEFVCRTHAQQLAIDNGYPYDVRTTIDGFPIIMAYRLTPTSDLVFIGKYNFNNDKETEQVFGFRDIPGFDNSKMQCWEVLNNGHHLALFQDTTNFDKEWTDAFEARYPDKSTSIGDVKRFAQWLTTTADFYTEKWQHIDVYKMAAYYVYVMRFGAVDQMVKNAMFTSEDGQKFYYILYDNDTINGLRNDGYLVYPPTITRQSLDDTYTTEVYAYAGHESRLWNSLEADAEFMAIVKEVDASLYNAGLTYANVINMFDNEQSAKWCERVYNLDAQYKYVNPFVESGTNNLFMLQGSRQSHRRWWLSKRFAFIDSLFETGEYQSNVIELKMANVPKGVEFSITAGIDGRYGYGWNNKPLSYGIELTKGQSHTFTTEEVINIGDPIRVYAAPNLGGVDFSNFTPYLSGLNVGGVYTDTLGTQFKTLKLGVDSSTDSRRNTALKEISGIENAKKLEVLNIEGYQGLTTLATSGLTALKILKAYTSGLTSVSLPDGSPIELLELPSTIQGLVLSNANLISFDNIKMQGGWSALSTIDIKYCALLMENFTTIKDWYTNKTTTDAKCSLTMHGINWKNVSPADAIALGGIKTSGGVLSLKGKVYLSTATSEDIEAIKSIYGEHCFEPTSELYFSAPDGIYITGGTNVIEGDKLQLSATVVSDFKGRVEWSITSGTGVTVDANGLVTTTIIGGTRNIVVQARHIPTQGVIVTDSHRILINKRVRPTGGTISGKSLISSSEIYVLNIEPEGINTGYSVSWKVSGSLAESGAVFISEQGADSCIVGLNASVKGSFVLEAVITDEMGLSYTISKSIAIGTILTIVMNSSEDEDEMIAALSATVKYDSITVSCVNGGSVEIPINTTVKVTFPDVLEYHTPSPVEFISNTTEYTITVQYRLKQIGVFIEDIDGNLYNGDEWDGTKIPNGVAVLTYEHSLVVALANVLDERVAFGGSGNSLGLKYTKTKQEEDFEGRLKNIEIEKYFYTINDGITVGLPIAEACNAYIFPNGNNGYLGAFGEWYMVGLNITEVNRLLELCGGISLSDEKYKIQVPSGGYSIDYLSITGFDDRSGYDYPYSRQWGVDFYKGELSIFTGSRRFPSYWVRPFTELKIAVR